MFNSLSHILKRVHFCELYFLNEKWFNSMSHGSNYMSQCWKEGFNFYESCWRRGSILWVILRRRFQFCESFWKEGFNSVSHIFQNQVQFLESYFQKGFNAYSFFYWKNTLNHIQKKFNSLSHIKKVQLFESFWKKVEFLKSYEKKVQFVELYSIFQKKKRVIFKEQILWVVLLKGSILRVSSEKKVQFLKT